MGVIKELIRERGREKLTAWVGFSHGWECELDYTDPAGIRKIVKQATVTRFQRHQRTEEIDDKKVAEAVAPKIIDWRGLTFRVLSKFLAFDTGGIKLDESIPCTHEDKVEMLMNVPQFGQWVMESIADLELFRQQESEKNSTGSGDTSGPHTE